MLLPEPLEQIRRSLTTLVDPTDFGTILRYYDSPISDIKDVILVDDSLPIEAVGAVVHGASSSPAVSKQLLEEWVQTKKLSFLSHETVSPTFTRKSLEESQSVDCLYFPPLYVIKVR